jgi:hypothetical protein
VAFDDAFNPRMKKVLRYIATNCHYSAIGYSGPEYTNSWKRRTFEQLMTIIPFCRSNLNLE